MNECERKTGQTEIKTLKARACARERTKEREGGEGTGGRNADRRRKTISRRENAGDRWKGNTDTIWKGKG